ncbi:MAG: hypothetical protein SPF89_08845 [Sphaerochaetaceae bacterium]|nr:hypothetical protein [Spirochaetales bacterium]MDY5500198.1 hypothetical protein [Sphaerochaetaceae bacterium]
MKYHIAKGSLEETLVLPLYSRYICAQRYPHIFPGSRRLERLFASLDCEGKLLEGPMGSFAALAMAERHQAMVCEVRGYLLDHPRSCLVNLGCGLDDTIAETTDGSCQGYLVDRPEVIAIRARLVPPGKNETCISANPARCDWVKKVDAEHDVMVFSAGLFPSLTNSQVKQIVYTLSHRFAGGVLVFDACNHRGAKLLHGGKKGQRGTEADAPFCLDRTESVKGWSGYIQSVAERNCMRGYQDLEREVGWFSKALVRFCENGINFRIVKVLFQS